MSKKLTLLSTLLTGSTLFAQDTVQTQLLNEVVVTANKTEQKQSSTGKVVTVITKAQIEKSTGKTVAQLLNEQAGVIINGALSNTGAVQTVFMRGAGAGRTLILMDGIPVNDPSQISNDFDLNFFSINDVERIEICKGAQSTLYGSDAIAGVINIITTKSNITKPANVKATLAGGSFGTQKLNLQFYGKTGKLTYTTRYAHLQTNGFSAAYDSTGTKNYDNDSYVGNTFNIALQYQATEKLMLKGFTQTSAYNAGIDASAFNDKTFYDIHNTNRTSGAGFVFKKTGISVTGNYQFSKQHRNYDDNASTGAPVFSVNDYNARTHFAEIYSSIKLGSGFTLLGGADYRYGLMNNEYRSVSVFGPYNSKFNDTSMNQFSTYLSLLFNKQQFSMEIGGRLTDHSRYGTHYTYTINPSYAFDEHFRIFGSIASAFKAPSLYQLYAAGAGNPDLKAELAANYEVGLQHSYRNFSDRLVFFYRKTDNGIDYNSVTYKYFNYVKQITHGVEYEINYQPVNNLTLTGNYTFITAQETTQSRVSFKDTLYNYSLRRPAHMLNLTTGYRFSKGLYASISGKYVSDRNDVGAYKKADVLLDDYFIINAYAEYTFGERWKLFGDVQNLANRKFSEIRGYNGIPTLFNAGITFNW
jgi:vitamin B12 transporter